MRYKKFLRKRYIMLAASVFYILFNASLSFYTSPQKESIDRIKDICMRMAMLSDDNLEFIIAKDENV
jgi:hypothetical protein